MFLFLLLLIFYFPFTIIQACPTNSIPSYKNSSMCYFLQSNKSHFIDAEGICMGFGGHLVSIHDMFENLFLSEKAFKNFTDSASGDFWIGANDLSTVGKWSWMDNTPFDFVDWEKGEPQNISNCGAMRMQDGKWITDDCYKQKPFICLVYVSLLPTTTTTVSPLKSCPNSWIFYNLTQSCYKVFNINSTWQDAEFRCTIDHAHLTSIHSFEESAFVSEIARPDSGASDLLKQIIIGLYTEDNNTHWQWTDGTPFDYPKWSPNEPNNPGFESCGEMFAESFSVYKENTFNNYTCSKILPKFVCKKLLKSITKNIKK